jgi:hypothetical protein
MTLQIESDTIPDALGRWPEYGKDAVSTPTLSAKGAERMGNPLTLSVRFCIGLV